MNWKPFRWFKRKTLTDEQKIAFADIIARMLEIQLATVGDKTMASEAGGPKRKAIGYVYGYIDAILRTKGWDMADAEIGPPITFQVIRRLWPGKELEYFDFLADHLADPIVGAGMMHGRQQYTEPNRIHPMGLARYILHET